MASGKILRAKATYGQNTGRGMHLQSGHDHQVNMIIGGNGSTAILGLNTNSILLQFIKVGLMSGTFVTWRTNTEYATSTYVLASGKLTHSSVNLTKCLMIASWDQPDA
jgi:hypothetical protein